MLYTVLFLAFLYAVVQGFVRTVVFFWDWLSRGRKLDADDVEHAEWALVASEDALERELARAKGERGLGRVFSRWRASRAAVEEYLDHLRLGWYQIVIIFLLGSMSGLLIEEVFTLVRQGLTQNRVGLVWGPFSPLYGLAAVLLTLLSFVMRKHRVKTWQVFLICAAVGGILEQFAGWTMSTLFNVESWSYLHLPDHITQWVAWRMIVAWGILGLIWAKLVTPRLLYQIGMPTTRRQVVFVLILAVYLVADIGMTFVCFGRMTARDAGVPPANAFEEWVDTHFSDEFIASRFQNLTVGGQEDETDDSAEEDVEAEQDGASDDVTDSDASSSGDDADTDAATTEATP